MASIVSLRCRSPPPVSNNPSATQQTTIHRSFHSTPTPYDQLTINVPTMGDSITEGTIVEWVAAEGTAVSEGDVICLVETDKVTVDIKADKDGVVVKHLGEVEGVVEVGEGLYVLDTDLSAATSAGGAAAVDNAASSAAIEQVPKVEEAPAPVVAAPAKPTTRVPSIHFLGKEGWEALRKGSSGQSQSSGTTIISDAKPQSPTSITYQPYVHMYGRPSITEEEMEALMLGGAEEAPEVKKEKSGVVSFYGGKVRVSRRMKWCFWLPSLCSLTICHSCTTSI